MAIKIKKYAFCLMLIFFTAGNAMPNSYFVGKKYIHCSPIFESLNFINDSLCIYNKVLERCGNNDRSIFTDTFLYASNDKVTSVIIKKRYSLADSTISRLADNNGEYEQLDFCYDTRPLISGFDYAGKTVRWHEKKVFASYISMPFVSKSFANFYGKHNIVENDTFLHFGWGFVQRRKKQVEPRQKVVRIGYVKECDESFWIYMPENKSITYNEILNDLYSEDQQNEKRIVMAYFTHIIKTFYEYKNYIVNKYKEYKPIRFEDVVNHTFSFVGSRKESISFIDESNCIYQQILCNGEYTKIDTCSYELSGCNIILKRSNKSVSSNTFLRESKNRITPFYNNTSQLIDEENIINNITIDTLSYNNHMLFYAKVFLTKPYEEDYPYRFLIRSYIDNATNIEQEIVLETFYNTYTPINYYISH